MGKQLKFCHQSIFSIQIRNPKDIISIFMWGFLINFVCNQVLECNSTNVTTNATTNSSTVSSPNIIESQNITGSPNKTKKIIPSNFNHEFLVMCKNDSNSFCKCSQGVVDCNFVNATPADKKNLAIHLSAREIDNSIKRICICNTKRNVYISLVSKFLPATSPVHRMDIFNLSGYISFADSSYLNFGGDLYMSNVKYLVDIKKFQFGRQDITIEDVQYLPCCSQIAPKHLARPVLYIENTTIGTIEENGIYPNHLWKTVVLKFVRIQKGMDRYAIMLQDKLNASISHSFFNNLNDSAIVVDNVANFVMIKSTFNHSCHPLAFMARTTEPNSTLALIGNRFLNVPQIRLDAKWVISWFNFFDIWHNETFTELNSTEHPDRAFSMEFNTVDRIEMTSEEFPILQNNTNVVFNENILSRCNCSNNWSRPLPPLLSKSNQRCDGHMSVKNTKCTLNLMDFNKQCKANSKVDVNALCEDDSNALNLIHSKSFRNLSTKTPDLRFDSPFVLRMIKEVEYDCPYRMQKVVKYTKLYSYTEEEFEANDTIEYFEECSSIFTDSPVVKKSIHKSQNKVKIIFIAFFSVVLLLAGVVSLFYFIRKRVLLGGANRYMSLNTY